MLSPMHIFKEDYLFLLSDEGSALVSEQTHGSKVT